MKSMFEVESISFKLGMMMDKTKFIFSRGVDDLNLHSRLQS